jgi:hypothetical protein
MNYLKFAVKKLCLLMGIILQSGPNLGERHFNGTCHTCLLARAGAFVGMVVCGCKFLINYNFEACIPDLKFYWMIDQVTCLIIYHLLSIDPIYVEIPDLCSCK